MPKIKPFLWPLCLAAGLATAVPAQARPRVLTASQAFHVSASPGEGSVNVRWVLAPGIELYRKSIRFTLTLRKGQTLTRFSPKALMPGSHWVTDVLDQRVRVFTGRALALLRTKSWPQGKPVKLVVNYRGCSVLSHICYMPQTRTFSLR